MIKKYIFLFLFVWLFSAAAASAENNMQAYRQYMRISSLSIKVPTLIQVPLPIDLGYPDHAYIKNEIISAEKPEEYNIHSIIPETPFSVSARPIPSEGNNTDMTDNNLASYAEFALPEAGLGQVTLHYKADAPIASSQLSLTLDQFVEEPTMVSVSVLEKGEEKMVLANQFVKNRNIFNFPLTKAQEWKITFMIWQPLRIAEIKLTENQPSKTENFIRFLAQPDTNYLLFFDPEEKQDISHLLNASFSTAKNVLIIPKQKTYNNASSRPQDSDGDGVLNKNDNCPQVKNPRQEDENRNRQGDTCEDFDLDGIIQSKDNCPQLPNENQADKDSDGIGDVCDKEGSRITEKYPWLPWLGIGSAALVLVLLIVLTVKPLKEKTANQEPDDHNNQPQPPAAS